MAGELGARNRLRNMAAVGSNTSEGISVPDLCALIGDGWDCRGSSTSSGFLLEIFRLPTLRREICDSYLLLPAENTWRSQTRVLLYAFGIAYCFIGLATITEKFMEAMDNIVKQTRRVVRKTSSAGVTEVRQERIWNSTVADITLLALGTSSPQISLAIIDSLQHLGEVSIQGVGPGTLIGSAAFNLFPILAVCVLLPKRGAVKRIEKMGVLIVELSWSIWAYIWLFFMLKVSSPDEISLWEALLTVLQFPLLILHAYAEDRDWEYVSVAFWYRMLAALQASGTREINPHQQPSDSRESDDCPVSERGKRFEWSLGWFRQDKVRASMLSTRNGQRSSELAVVSSESTQSTPSRNYDSNGVSEIRFLPVDEVHADSPLVILLHQNFSASTRENLSLSDTWKAQLYHAMTVESPQDTPGKRVIPGMPALLKHAITIFWRILFAFIVPPDVLHGWPTFVCTLFCIAGISAIVIQLANLLGCVSGITDYVIAITILAIGTSWPDLVASKIAVESRPTADSGIANINTSNCINIFVGIGIPWLIQVSYNRVELGKGLNMQTSGLSFSLVVYFVTFTLCWVTVLSRRYWLGGELGGPRNWARASSGFFILLWCIFVAASCLRVYNVI